jgi:hypothetical protein
MRLKRGFIVGAVFWAVLLVSLTLGERYQWIGTAWGLGCVAFLVITSVYSVLEIFEHHHASGEYIYHRGAPRWMRWLLQDEDDYAKDIERRTRRRL